jgi:hypothetical protein
MGQRAATTGVKFQPGSPSTLGEKVTSGLVWRFGTFDCVSDNLACFKDGLSDSGSFLDVGGHRFYVAKPFSEEVTDMATWLTLSVTQARTAAKASTFAPWLKCWP